MVLQTGVTYTLIARGDFQFSPRANDRADAQYHAYDRPTPRSTDGVTPIGIEVTGVTTTGSPPRWGAYRRTHTYAIQVVGRGQPLHAFYQDAPASYRTHQGALTLLILNGPGASFVFGVHKNQPLTLDTPGVLAADPGYQNLSTVVNEITEPPTGNLDLNADGSFTYTPPSGFTGDDSLAFTSYDFEGDSVNGPFNVTFNVHYPNELPSAADYVFTTSHGRELDVPVEEGLLSQSNDPDSDPVAIAAVNQPRYGSVRWNADGTFSYLPNGTYLGTDSFTYQISDGQDVSNLGTVTVNLTNDAPTVTDSFYHVTHDQVLDVSAPGIMAGAYDPDGDSMAVQIVAPPQSGHLDPSPDGSFTYRPNDRFVGTDTFTYYVTDSLGAASAIQTATIQVTNAAPVTPPVFNRFIYIPGFPFQFDLLNDDAFGAGSVYDPDGDPLTFTFDTPSHGTVQPWYPAGTFRYASDPNSDYGGWDSFYYHVSDGVAQTDGLISLFLDTSPNLDHLPTDFNPTYWVQANETDVDQNTLSGSASYGTIPGLDVTNPDEFMTQEGSPSGGVLESFDRHGNFVYKPNQGFSGQDSFPVAYHWVGHGVALGMVVINVVNLDLQPAGVARTDRWDPGAYVGLDADKVANSREEQGVPDRRNLDTANLPQDSPDLLQVDVVANPLPQMGSFTLSVSSTGAQAGDIKLWDTAKKNNLIGQGTGDWNFTPAKLPQAFYIEGVSATQAPSWERNITVTLTYHPPPAPGEPPILNRFRLSVTPIVGALSVTPGQIVIRTGPSSTGKFQVKALEATGPGATFLGTVFRTGSRGDGDFIQNVDQVTNGINRQPAGVVRRPGMGPNLNLVLSFNDVTYPVLDNILYTPPYYVYHFQRTANEFQILTADDDPFIAPQVAFQTVSRYAIRKDFSIYLVWHYPDDVFYPLARVHWWVIYSADLVQGLLLADAGVGKSDTVEFPPIMPVVRNKHAKVANELSEYRAV